MNLLIALVLGAVILMPGMALSSMVLNFDDISGTGESDLPVTYHGLNWSGGNSSEYWQLIDNSEYRDDYNNSFNFPSNPNAVFNGSDSGYGASVVEISGTTPFDFLGAYFGTWTADNYYNWYGATELRMYGIFERTLVATATFGLAPGPLSYHVFNNFNNIDTLQFVANGNFLMDNFTTSGVPLPGAMILLGAGLVRLASYARRRRKQVVA